MGAKPDRDADDTPVKKESLSQSLNDDTIDEDSDRPRRFSLLRKLSIRLGRVDSLLIDK